MAGMTAGNGAVYGKDTVEPSATGSARPNAEIIRFGCCDVLVDGRVKRRPELASRPGGHAMVDRLDRGYHHLESDDADEVDEGTDEASTEDEEAITETTE
jgi:hypothetical protein